MGPSRKAIGRQARRRPSKELSVEVEGSEDLQIAEVEFSEESHPEEEGRNGERPVIDLTHRHSHSHFRLAATVAGKQYNFTGTWGSSALSDLLEVLSSEGLNLRCCQTCSKYRVSGMVADWSFGTEGYCLLRGEPKMEELTHMLHVCPFWQRRPELVGGE